MKKLWGSRFSQETEKRALSFTSSLSFDKRLYRYDILGSIAHVRMLASCGIISEGDGEVIVAALEEVEKEMSHDQFSYLESDEDIHTAVERGVVEKVGSEIGGKLHTARSRNDQVALDLRMYLKDEQTKIMTLLVELIEAVLSLARNNLDLFFPGYTHLQRAQPVLLSHHFMAYGEMFRRDYERLETNFENTDYMPLGSGALAGVSYPVDREMVARELKFSRITRNSMDAVSDRDFALEFLSNASILMVHLSRLAEEMILWSTPEFGFIELPDRYTTGSSMMPQKKNPDIWELVRGKTGRVMGNLSSLLVVLKGLPLSYNRDLQEDKELVFDTIDTVKEILPLAGDVLLSTKINQDRIAASMSKGFLTATDMADYLVKKGVPFRKAHRIVGKVVLYCSQNSLTFEELGIDTYKQFDNHFDQDIYEAVSLSRSIASKNIAGGTARQQVADQIKETTRWVEEKKEDLRKLRERCYFV